MKGKKKEKFHITVGFACNADGSERWPPIYIGKSKMPRCFQNKTGAQLGFYYRSNTKAWMTSELFEEYAIYYFLSLTGLTVTLDGSSSETLKCGARTAISASLLTIFRVISSCTNLKTFNLNTSNLISHLLSNPLMPGSSDASKHIIGVFFVLEHLILMKQARPIFTGLTSLKGY